PSQAERQARVAFGGLEQMKELSRDAWGIGVFERATQDLCCAFRALRRTPGFTLTAIVTLALGLGASVAVFSVVDAVYFSRLPYRESARLVRIGMRGAGPPCRPTCERGLTSREIQEWAPRLDSIEALARLTENSDLIT